MGEEPRMPGWEMYISAFREQSRLTTMEKVKWLVLGQAGHFLAGQRSEAGSFSREHKTTGSASLSE